MKPVDIPAGLAASRWQEQESTALKADVKLKSGELAELLRQLRQAHDACDLDCFDVDTPVTTSTIDMALSELDGEATRGARKIAGLVRSVRDLAGESLEECEKVKTLPRSVTQALSGIAKQAAELSARWSDALSGARSRLQQRRAESLLESPDQRLLRVRLTSALNEIKKAKEDAPEMKFLALVGVQMCRVFVGHSIGAAQRNKLAAVMGADAEGAKPYRGTCIWEGNAYTFVSNRADSKLVRQLRQAIIEVTRRKVPLRVRRPSP